MSESTGYGYCFYKYKHVQQSPIGVIILLRTWVLRSFLIVGYSEDGGAKKGDIIPEHEFAAGTIRLDDEQEFPPVSSQSN